MAERKDLLYVLPADAVNTSEAQKYPEFPGVWRPGEPQDVRVYGLDEVEAERRIGELELPLKRVNQPVKAEPVKDEPKEKPARGEGS